MGQAPGVGQHQLDPVLLVDLGGAGVIVDGHDVGVRVVVLQLADHTLAHNVVGQAAEGLGAHDVLVPEVNELQHLGGEEPALAHLVAVPQIAVDQPVEVLEGAGGAEAARVFQGLNHVLLTALHIAHKDLAGRLLDPLAPVQVHVGHTVVNLEDDEVGEAGDHRLHPLAEEELLQIVVAQGGELHIDLSHHPHADLGLAWTGMAAKSSQILANRRRICPRLMPLPSSKPSTSLWDQASTMASVSPSFTS